MPTIQRDAATAGQVTQAVAGADAIEIKATVPGPQIAAALAHFGMTADNDEERYIDFFDTPRLDGLNAGLIFRARRVVGGEHDSTVKFRPVDPAKVDKRWHKYRGFKVEVDASEKGMVRSASFSMPVEKELIKRVAAGEATIRCLIARKQLEFLRQMAAAPIDDKHLAVLRPIGPCRRALPASTTGACMASRSSMRAATSSGASGASSRWAASRA